MEEPELPVDKVEFVIPELDEEYPELSEKEKFHDGDSVEP